MPTGESQNVVAKLPWYGSHSYLNEYIRLNSCRRLMEIGVLDGENARTMVEVAMEKHPPGEVEYYGFDFFEDSGEEVKCRLEKTRCKFKLFRGDTLETLPRAVKDLPKMDLIFIDGDKSYRTAKSDWETSKTLMHERTGVFVHNYEFSGVRKMVDSIPRDSYQVTIIRPPSEGYAAVISMKALKTSMPAA
jgi:predicted O-methyltransferase YrrM